MAFTTCALIVTFMTITTAAIFGEPNNNHFQRFPPRMHKIHHIKPKFSMPDFDREDFLPPMPHMPRMPHMPPMPSMPEMPSIPAMPSMPDMPSIPAMPPLTHDLIRAHVAGDNEKYSGSSYSSHSHSTIINGKETFEGSVSSLINDGHHVEEKIMEYGN
ncbi:RNA-binding protein 12 isoform X2 [Manduca sexta]|uniref:RNA-binding protein 12 isoform X2 n=1 Tax=Manduca sexta TaxID=7130 RepID=UPI0011831E97|nr:RNA-binding protein 12 isoform X2 [Manduca sexta]XP_037298749.1 RNA-binding protein 12 isoform X2 [Manduca sexta]